MKTYRSNGKLLLTAEYAVLDGAVALAIPTVYGQTLNVENSSSASILWKSYDEAGEIWFEHEFPIDSIVSNSAVDLHNPTANRILEILRSARILNLEFLSKTNGLKVDTYLDFNRHWGLGSSSTLINNIASWAQINAYQLLEKTFGGSGYDIACAQHNSPLLYQLTSQNVPGVKPVDFNPVFRSNLYFVYLNQKQDSRDGISKYKKQGSINPVNIEAISNITKTIIACQSLTDFNILIKEHESIIAKLIGEVPIKEQLFKDFDGEVKSLGAWGGDFVLASSVSDPTAYFKSKGYNTIIPYQEMALFK
ncbi:GYDIA family GHMP kinase [Winogradskyella aurantia]|uniref:GHMP kinase n=1 Tax=Winogradskyella aurantia TaxID=1915063 RepID=A0A265UVE5_9FLAO|nr:GYDIA family GHMP kinase [Winogradskyella aurantia]OZV69283.1 GHMP kinase [Winogradskyella aurantia]